MASSIKAEPGLDLFYGTQTSYKQQLKGHQASYSCFSKTPTLPIIGLQSRDKAVMLVIKSIIFSPRIYVKMVFTSQRRETLCSWPGTNMATVTSRANQQHLSLILSNSRSSLKTPFHLRSRCSNERGRGGNRASESANGTRGRREMASRFPHPPRTRPSFPFHPPSFTGPVVRSTFWYICFLVFKFYFNSI